MRDEHVFIFNSFFRNVGRQALSGKKHKARAKTRGLGVGLHLDRKC